MKTALDKPLRIALIVHGWDLVVQRPHHWQRQAALRGHDFHVYTMPAPLGAAILRSSLHPVPNVHRLPRNLFEGVLRRLGNARVAMDRKFRRFERFVQSNVVARCGLDYDVVIYSSFPCRLERRGREGVLIYDCMDEWSGFADLPAEVTEWEQRIASRADLILAVSEPLAARLARQHGAGKVMLVPNGCDYDFFASHTLSADSQAGSLTIGYIGTIREWFDWDAVLTIAQAYPEACVRLVGPAENVPTDLPQNVQLTGRQPYENMPVYNAGFDVCIIPFRDPSDTRLVEWVSPIKLYEYLASGKPVVSSIMPDAVKLAEKGILHIADSPDAFAAEIAEAIQLAREPVLIARRRAIAQQNSWTARWLQVENRIRQLLGSGSLGEM